MERWKINLYTIWFSQILSISGFSFAIPFIPFYIQELGIRSPESIKYYSGLIYALPAITMAIMSPIWGILADKFGKRLMLLRASLSGALIITGMGFATGVSQLMVLRLFQGIFTGTVSAAASLISSSSPKNKLSFSLGFLSSSTFIGSALGPVLGGILAEKAGYRVSFYVGGIILFIGFLIVLLAVKEEEPQKNIAPIRIDATDVSNLSDHKERIPWIKSITLLLNTRVVAVLSIIFLMRIIGSIFAPYLPLFIQELRPGLEGNTMYTGIVNGACGFMVALSGLTITRLGDTRDKKSLIQVLLIICIVSSIPLIFSTPIVYFTLFYSIFFFFVGAIEPTATSISTQVTDPKKHGTLFGIQALIGSLGWMLSPAIGGYISVHYSLHTILFLIPIIISLALPVSYFLKKDSIKCKSL